MKEFLLEIAQDKRKDLPAVLLRPLLSVLSFLYGWFLFLIRSFYRLGIFPGYRPKVKVISVGNITLGGTGKTPLVEFLAHYLIQTCRRKVCVLSRGYSQDEPTALAKNLPQARIICGRDRIKSSQEAVQRFSCDTIILDDGLQHWRLQRDLDIVTINSCNPFGNRHLIPRGILREPVSSIRRCDIIVLTKVDLGSKVNSVSEELREISPDSLIVESIHQPLYFYDPGGQRRELNSIRNKDICLLSSIADPDSFRKILFGLGAKIVLDLEYPDHYRYQKEDILKIISLAAEKNIDTIMTTEKDFMRIPGWAMGNAVKLFVLRVGLKITKNEKQFLDRISGLLAA